MDVDVVIIGLNAANTLETCLKSVSSSAYRDGEIRIFYVDSGSSDDSIALAQNFPGVVVLELDTEHPSPGAGRNLGWKTGSAPLVQFIDSDTELHEDWLVAAASFLKENSEVAAVRGNRVERNPDASIYNWIADQEWNAPPGECSDFGGDVLIRREVLERTEGYDEILVGGEDPELSQRVRKSKESPNQIHQLDVEMTNHDMSMFRVRQYWKRGYRTGYGFAAVLDRHPETCDGFWKTEYRRILVRGGVAPILFLAGLIGGLFWWPIWIVCALGLGLVFFPRLLRVDYFAKSKNLELHEAKKYAWHCSLVVIPECFGVVRYWVGKFFRKPLRNKRAERSETGVLNNVATLLVVLLLILSTSCTVAKPGLHEHYEGDRRSQQKHFNVDDQFQWEVEKKEIDYASGAELANFTNKIPTDYLIGPGDVLSIETRQRPEASVERLVVSPDGKVAIPRIGIVNVKNTTIDWLTEAVQTELKNYYNEPEVNIMITEYNNNKVFVLGRISNPGRVELEGDGSLLEVLAACGGLPTIAEEAFLTRAMIFRGKDTVMWVNLRELLNEGNTAMNPKLRNNDVIFIPESDDELVYVLGEVRNPGAVKLKTELSYLDAVMAVGGPTYGAKKNRLYLIRKDGSTGYVQPVDMGVMIAEGDFRQDFLLKDGDILYVTPTPLRRTGNVISEFSPVLSYLSLATAFGSAGAVN